MEVRAPVEGDARIFELARLRTAWLSASSRIRSPTFAGVTSVSSSGVARVVTLAVIVADVAV